MTNEEKAKEIIKMSDTKQVYDIVDFKSLEEALYDDLMQMAKWKEQQIINILREMEIEEDDVVDYANEYQCSPEYGFSGSFIKRLKQSIEDIEE